MGCCTKKIPLSKGPHLIDFFRALKFVFSHVFRDFLSRKVCVHIRGKKYFWILVLLLPDEIIMDHLEWNFLRDCFRTERPCNTFFTILLSLLTSIACLINDCCNSSAEAPLKLLTYISCVINVSHIFLELFSSSCALFLYSLCTQIPLFQQVGIIAVGIKQSKMCQQSCSSQFPQVILFIP